jgi:uncharacterized membrane protein YccC
MVSGIVGWMRAHDPNGTALHKAIKVAIAVTLGLAIGTAVDNAQLSLFASFGGVALLLFADFPGGASARLGAYLGLYLVGLALIALGTVMSPVAWMAVTGMLVTGFLVLFSGVLSAAIAGAARAALLAFILPVMVPVPVSEIPSRWAGWTLAAMLSIPLAVFLWPPRDHDRLRRAAGDACGALADQLTGWASGADPAALETVHADAGRAITELRTQFRRTSVRPVALTTGSRQLMRLPDRLEWLRTVIDRLPSNPARTVEGARVADACVRTLRSAAAVLAEAPRRPSFATRQELSIHLRALRQLHVAGETFARLVESATQPDPAVHPSTMLEVVHTTRLTGQTVAASAAADARPLLDRLVGRNPPGAATGTVSSTGMLAVPRVLTGHLTVRSVWFQNSVRGALGLAIAVAIAEITDVSHGFWVVLGAMSVLRTTALTTGSTALRAIGGTVIGFAVGAAVMLLVGTTAWHLWLLLPVTLLIAGYLPEVVSFVAGQAAFTVLVVVLFNIISQTGWQVGLVRVEDVLFGCASALISGVLLWPRGAAAAIRKALAEYYRRSADAVVAATDQVVGTAGGGERPIGQAMSDAAVASLRLDDALREYLFERGTRNVPLDALTALANGAGRIRMTAEAVAELTPVADPGQSTADVLTGTAGAARDWFGHLADRLELHRRDAPPLPAPAVPTAERTVLADALDFWADHPVADQSVADQSVAAGRPGLLADGRTRWMAALYLDNLCWLQRRLVARSAELDGRARAAGPWPDLPAGSDAHR